MEYELNWHNPKQIVKTSNNYGLTFSSAVNGSYTNCTIPATQGTCPVTRRRDRLTSQYPPREVADEPLRSR